MEFKEFLKNRPKNILYYSFFDDSKFVLSKTYEKPDNVIEVKKLGEWAWNRIQEDVIGHIGIYEYGSFEKKESFFQYLDRCLNTITDWEIAVACLGEKEINIRLKRLKK